MRCVALLVGALAVSGAQAEALGAFDLRCDTRTGVPVHFRFDSTQKKWCSGACQSVRSVAKFTDRLIQFSVHGADRGADWTMQIDRYSGTFSAMHMVNGSESSDGGQCFPLPFSGFPEQRF